ncbi:hypothetical protein SEA_POTTY_63 [Microbacterium phage Potty]|nr:hypothetical protein SEA_NEPTUNE_64 [Microbacterium phage Neptune]UDL15542.1 hypothetical protein SEA_CYBELE_64 [Microbacterium phage Cybele]USH45261.1 hypothetical protein SEA_POTTY_63 [Microbacterium phage Potty]
MVGRQEFFAAQAKHAQRPLPYNQKPKPVNDDIWFSKGMEVCRDLASVTDNEWGKVGFSELMSVSQDEAERRLRVLTRAGFLHMGVEKSPDGSFIRYTWRLRQPDLPRSPEITEGN